MSKKEVHYLVATEVRADHHQLRLPRRERIQNRRIMTNKALSLLACFWRCCIAIICWSKAMP